MKLAKPKPINVESAFGIDEMFFSTTDRKGIIQSGNDVFVRISKYTLEDLLDTPHSVIRHPDMPRAVFQLLWDYLLSGRTIAAYVKNLAADGSYYWVLALVTPLSDGGFLSIRIKPTSEILTTVQSLYAKLCKIEADATERGETSKQGMEQATAALLGALESIGCPDYDAFMYLALQTEMRQRDAAMESLASTARQDSAISESQLAISSTLQNALARLRESTRISNQLYRHVDSLLSFQGNLAKRVETVGKMARGFRFAALNTAVVAARLDGRGDGLCTVASHLGETSTTVAQLTDALSTQTQQTTATLMKTVFHLAAARLGIEISDSFCREAAKAGEQTHDPRHERQNLDVILSDLNESADSLLEALSSPLDNLLEELNALCEDAWRLNKTSITLRFVRFAGVLEAVHCNAMDDVGPLLHQLESEIALAMSEFRALAEDVNTLLTNLNKTPHLLEELRTKLTAQSRDPARSVADPGQPLAPVSAAA